MKWRRDRIVVMNVSNILKSKLPRSENPKPDTALGLDPADLSICERNSSCCCKGLTSHDSFQ